MLAEERSCFRCQLTAGWGDDFLIGVRARPEQAWAVEEFFELFKTPWEFFRSDHGYDVVIVTSNDVPRIDKGLLLLYQADSLEWDDRLGVAGTERGATGNLKRGRETLPIYSGLLSFRVALDSAVWAEGADGGAAATTFTDSPLKVVRFGYNLFDEVQYLLTRGQPIENASVPVLDLHVRMLRECVLEAGISLVEIPPVPAKHGFAICLTHDIDFIGIRRHVFDHSMWGFVYRATVGSIRRLLEKRLTVGQLLRNWAAVAFLPLVYMGLLRDFWESFEWYLNVEKGLPSTYFLIPIKRHPGNRVPGSRAWRRASGYDVTDMPEAAKSLLKHSCEIGVHGIDAWNSVEKGKFEAERIAKTTGKTPEGIRMHWLLSDQETTSKLEDAGFAYDSTVGYNETIGYRAGTNQVFRPIGSKRLLELPMLIQDGALFYPQRLNLTDQEASQACNRIIEHATQHGGIVTLLWHDRSHGPERFWGSFYARLIESLKKSDAWFGTCTEVSEWYRIRRGVKFESVTTNCGRRVRMHSTMGTNDHGMRIRIHRKDCTSSHAGEMQEYTDMCWDGRSEQDIEL